MGKVDGESLSDAARIKVEFAKHNYFVMHFVFDCYAYGSMAARSRIYFLGWSIDGEQPGLHLPSPVHLPESSMDFCDRFLNYFAISQFGSSRFLYSDPEVLAGVVFAFGEDSDNCIGVREKADKFDKDIKLDKNLKWKEEHCDAYRALGLSWPPELHEVDASMTTGEKYTMIGQTFTFFRGTLPDRQAELTLYLMCRCPLEGSGPEFFDANPSLPRLMMYHGCHLCQR